MRADALKSHGYSVRTEMNALTFHVYSTDEEESKGIIVHKTLSRSFYMDKDESKVIIINETLSQICSTDEAELCFTEEDKS